jgi:hypothetical protein
VRTQKQAWCHGHITDEESLFERSTVVRADGTNREQLVAAPDKEHQLPRAWPSSMVPSGTIESATPWVRSGPLSFFLRSFDPSEADTASTLRQAARKTNRLGLEMSATIPSHPATHLMP